VQHATIGAVQRHGSQAIELTYRSFGSGWFPTAKAAFRSMNAAEMVQHRLQQMRSAGCPDVGLARRKFHCVFKDSRAR
jgi:hypothetical protein